MEQSNQLAINKRTFIQTICLLVGLMLVAFILTQVLAMGTFERVLINGREQVVNGTYQVIEGVSRLAWWRFFTAPFEVFVSEDALTAIVIILVIMLVGGTFNILNKSGLFEYIVCLALVRFKSQKYVLLRIIVLFSMFLGSFLGMFEETITIIPVIVLIALSLGWDSFTGLGMSLLAVGLGFASGTFNPFTVGIAQEIAGLPLFSGLLMRSLFFLVVYVVYVIFLEHYARSIEKNPSKSQLFIEDEQKRKSLKALDIDRILAHHPFKKATRVFVGSFAVVILYIIISFMVPTLSDYSMPFMALSLMVGGLLAGKIIHYETNSVMKDFADGVLDLLPAVLLIVLALSVKQIIVEGQILDTILNALYLQMIHMPPYLAIVIIYCVVLLLELFIPSSSAKAFLIMPLILALGDLSGLTRQTIVTAYTFGDGFANVIYPTNALLLIALGMTHVPYTKWFKWVFKLEIVLFILCILFLWLAVAIQFGPF